MIEEDYWLLHRLSQGDISAMEVLYIRYAPRVKAFVLAILKSEADADDLVQEIFLKIGENKETVSKASSFESYLYTMTRNAVFNKLRKDRVHEKYRKFAKTRPEAYEPEERIQTKDLLAHINQELDKLSDHQRIIYDLSRNGNLTYKEISEQLNISPKTVQYHISSVLAKLRKVK